MAVPKWLDRIWLAIIGICFVIVAVLWVVVQGQRIGYLPICAIIIAALLERYWTLRRDSVSSKVAPMKTLSCGCTPGQKPVCERHTLMAAELARRHGFFPKSSTARENASNPSSSIDPAARPTDSPGITGPR